MPTAITSSCEDIFSISGEHPQKTYLDRVSFSNQLIDALKASQIALVYGLSKIGKTLLVKYVLQYIDRPRIWIYGNQIDSEDALWEILAEFLTLADSYHKSRRKGKIDILKKLTDEKYCLIIDDYHYVPTPKVRLDTLHTLKILNGENIPVVLIGVQSPQLREIGQFPDMAGRIRSIELSAWSEDELILIANKGFSSRSTAVMQLTRLAQESFGSPFLMQLLCQLYCRQRLEKHLDSDTGYIERVEVEDLDIIFPQAAQSFSYAQVYSLLISPKACITNKVFIRHDGKRGNFNQIFWYALAGIYPIGSMPYLVVHLSTFWHRLSKILASSEELVSEETLFNGVALMVEQYQHYYDATYETFSRHDPIIDLLGNVFYVRDPFILFYLRHSPDIEKQFIPKN